MISYHDVREVSSGKARELVRKVLARNGGNVSETARVLSISRRTVRRARDGGLEDLSRRPLHSPRKTPDEFERLMVLEGRRTGFRYRRLSSYLKRKYALVFGVLRKHRAGHFEAKSGQKENEAGSIGSEQASVRL